MTTTTKFNPEARKALAKALAEILQTKSTYLGMPSAAYQIGDYHLAKDGELTGPDNLGLMVALLERGFEQESDKTFHLITPRGTLLCQERFDTAAEAEAAGYSAYFHNEGREVYIKPAPDGVTEHSKHFAVVGAPFEQAAEEPAAAPEPPAEPEADCVCIEIPLEGFTPEKLDNLAKMVAAKEALIKQALGIDGPLPIQVLSDRIAFPWFTSTDGAEVNAYAQLIAALCRTAKEKTRVTAQPKEDHANPRFTMRCWLISLGLVGPEYKLIRKIMTSTLSGNGAWSTGIDPRKVERDAAKAAAEADTETETEVAGEFPGDSIIVEESEEAADE